MRSKVRILQFAYLFWVSACTASWTRVVQYSAEPSSHSVIVDVYRTVFASIVDGLGATAGPDSVAVEHSRAPARLEGLMSCAGVDVPNHWVDTLKHEVRIALVDLDCSELADSTALVRAAQSLGLVLLPAAPVAGWPLNVDRAGPPQIKLSSPGFNADSTIAAVRGDVACGLQCGYGETLLLARRPGKRWRVWYSFLHWIA
jgi:hypothetical protein